MAYSAFLNNTESVLSNLVLLLANRTDRWESWALMSLTAQLQRAAQSRGSLQVQLTDNDYVVKKQGTVAEEATGSLTPQQQAGTGSLT